MGSRIPTRRRFNRQSEIVASPSLANCAALEEEEPEFGEFSEGLLNITDHAINRTLEEGEEEEGNQVKMGQQMTIIEGTRKKGEVSEDEPSEEELEVFLERRRKQSEEKDGKPQSKEAKERERLAKQRRQEQEQQDARKSLLIIILVPLMLAVVATIWMNYANYKKTPTPIRPSRARYHTSPKREPKGPLIKKESRLKNHWMQNLNTEGIPVFTEEEIKYIENGPMYLIIAGHVFDVTSGKDMYGKGSGYHGFIGQDATRAFVTGEFNEKGLVPDMEGRTPADYKEVSKWIDFYFNHDTYKFAGLLQGWYFDQNGKPTEKMNDFIKQVEIAKQQEDENSKLEVQFPGCNSEWAVGKGTRVFCSHASGGVNRDWVGVPRLLKDRKNKYPRCVCVHPTDLEDHRLSEYKDCPPRSFQCDIPEEKK